MPEADPGRSGRAHAIGRLPIRDQRMYLVIVSAFMLATMAVSLYDAYLVVSLMSG
jgi:hypothetical protein